MPSAKAGRNQATDRGSPVLGRRGSRFHATSCCVWLGSIDGRGFNGKVAQTLVPEPLDSTTKSPQKWRMRSRIPVIPLRCRGTELQRVVPGTFHSLGLQPLRGPCPLRAQVESARFCFPSDDECLIATTTEEKRAPLCRGTSKPVV
jgi:hypothetical protein